RVRGSLKCFRGRSEIKEKPHERLLACDVAVRAEPRAAVLCHRVNVPALAVLKVDDDAHTGKMSRRLGDGKRVSCEKAAKFSDELRSWKALSEYLHKPITTR